jgi:hypothetical protein
MDPVTRAACSIRSCTQLVSWCARTTAGSAMSSSAAGPCNICGCTDFAQVCHAQESSVLVVCMATHARLAMSTMAIADSSSYLTQSSLARSSASEPMHRSSRITWPGCGCGYVVAICRFVARITPGCYNAPACCSALHDAHTQTNTHTHTRARAYR